MQGINLISRPSLFLSFLQTFSLLNNFTFFSYLSLVFGSALPHQRGMVDQTIFGRVVFRLECPKQRLLRTQDLDGGGRVFCQIHEGTFKVQIQRNVKLQNILSVG